MNWRVCKMLIASNLVALSFAAPSMGQQADGAGDGGMHETSVMKMVGPDGNATVMVVSDGVPQTFTVAPDGSLVSVDGNQQAVFPPGAVGGKMAMGVAGNGSGVQPFVFNGGNPADVQAAAKQAMENARQRAADALKDALGCSDNEWSLLWPKVQKIQALQSASLPGSVTSALKGGSDVPTSVAELRVRIQDFQKLVNNKDVSDAQVTQSLASVRDARNKVKTELAQLRKELTELVTPRQEATLYQRGILD